MCECWSRDEEQASAFVYRTLRGFRLLPSFEQEKVPEGRMRERSKNPKLAPWSLTPRCRGPSPAKGRARAHKGNRLLLYFVQLKGKRPLSTLTKYPLSFLAARTETGTGECRIELRGLLLKHGSGDSESKMEWTAPLE
jgi:hypothetical protein